jgi:4-amino-4-deoxy-L-arabinose transferase-like glycosyltransferase
MRILRLENSLKEIRGSALMTSALVLAVVLRILTLLRNDPVAFDSAAYFEMAEFLRAGRWANALAYDYPPLFPILVAGLQEIGLSAESAGLLLAFVSNLLVLLPLIVITRRIAGQTAACGAAFLWAIHPYAVRLGSRALTDAPTALFVALSLWFGLRALEKEKIQWGIGAGLASGLAYLMRPEGTEPALALAALWLFTSSGRMHQRIAWAAAPLLGWAILASPYVAYLSLESGSLTLSKKKSSAAMVGSFIPGDAAQENSQPPAVSSPEQTTPESSTQADSKAPASPVHRLLRNVYIFQQPLVNGIHPVVLIFAALAPWGIRSEKEGKRFHLLALLIALFLLHLVILVGVASTIGPDYLGGHHFFLMVLYLLPFSGAGLAGILVWLRRRLPNFRWLPAIVLTITTVATIPSSVLRSPERGAIMREGGAWIRNHSSSSPVVVTDSAKVSYHAGAERVPFPGDYSQAERQAHAQEAQWIALYAEQADDRFSHLQKLVDSGELEAAAEFWEQSGKRVYYLRIYRLRKTT